MDSSLVLRSISLTSLANPLALSACLTIDFDLSLAYIDIYNIYVWLFFINKIVKVKVIIQLKCVTFVFVLHMIRGEGGGGRYEHCNGIFLSLGEHLAL